jgi:hypothetical protein
MTLNVYLISTRRKGYVLFSPTDNIEACEAESGDHVTQFIGWVMRSRYRFVAWAGRVLHVGHAYYEKLEDRIDPVERVLKAMACTNRLQVHSAPMPDAETIRSQFQQVLRRQRAKHKLWLVIDAIVSLVVVAFTPILVPIPGPNVVFYYPFLRLLSHYRALRGAASGLRSSSVEFKSLPELSGLEENLQTRFDRNFIRSMSDRLRIRGLERFLERMV